MVPGDTAEAVALNERVEATGAVAAVNQIGQPCLPRQQAGRFEAIHERNEEARKSNLLANETHERRSTPHDGLPSSS